MRFYTFVPKGVYHPYHFYTFFQNNGVLNGEYEHAIIDTGVGLLFHHRNMKDYPPYFLIRYEKYAKWLTSKLGMEKVSFVIPDYPADYHQGKCKSAENNVDRTIENIKRFITIDGVDWIPVIQSPYMDIEGFRESCKKTKEVIGDYKKVAIGTVCKTNNVEFIVKCCKLARQYFPSSWIHAFGLTLSALPKVIMLINSFDTTAWTKPRGRGLPSAKNTIMRIQYFKAYLDKVNKIINNANAQMRLFIL